MSPPGAPFPVKPVILVIYGFSGGGALSVGGFVRACLQTGSWRAGCRTQGQTGPFRLQKRVQNGNFSTFPEHFSGKLARIGPGVEGSRESSPASTRSFRQDGGCRARGTPLRAGSRLPATTCGVGPESFNN